MRSVKREIQGKMEDNHYCLGLLQRRMTTNIIFVICFAAILLVNVNVMFTTSNPKTHIALAQEESAAKLADSRSASGGSSSSASGDNTGTTTTSTEETGSSQMSPRYLVYSNPDLGFRISYPAGSRVEEPNNFDGVLISIPGRGVAGVSVLDNRFSSVSDFAESDMASKSGSHPDIRVVKTSQTTISGLPAEYTISAYTTDRGSMMKVLNEYVIGGDKAYHLIFLTSGSVSALVPVVAPMLRSFEISDVSSSSTDGNTGSPSDSQDTSSSRPLRPTM
jgi:hypothetical protein